MERFVKGDVVVIPFPFSDLSTSKRRPALVLSDLLGNDVILCQITSVLSPKDRYSIPLTELDFQWGKLIIDSYARPNRVFTAEKKLIIKKIGAIRPVTYEKIVNKLVSIIS